MVALLGQNVLTGKVVDSATQRPIPFATVYFDGTTNGQTTDDNGQFSLTLKGIELPAVLVVSHVGYRTQILNITTATETLAIQLSLQGQLMGTVVVQDRNQRLKNIEEFRRLFLGSDEWGKRARIQNEEALLFERDYATQKVNTTSKYMRRMALKANPGRVEWAVDSSYFVYDKALNLQAVSKVPLVVELPHLGYSLRVDLVRFLTEYKSGRTGYLGHYFFISEEGPDGKVRPQHQKNRQRAFFNSSLHFLRSLFSGTLAENGYQVLEAVKDGTAKEKKLLPFDITPFLHRVEKDQLEIRGLAGRQLVILYYGDARGRPIPANKWKNKQPVQSGMHFGENACRIRPDGTVGDSDLAFSGYIGSHGVAWILPSDYEQ